MNLRCANRAAHRTRVFVFAVAASVCLIALLTGNINRRWTTWAAPAPVLVTQPNSTRAIAVDAQTELSEPFALTARVPFGPDNRTRVMVFATNLTLAPGDTASSVTAGAEDAVLFQYPLTVEYVGPVPGQTWMTAVVLR